MRPPLSVTASASMRAVACAASVAYATSAARGIPQCFETEARPPGGGLATVSPKWHPVRRRSGRTIQDCASYDFQQLGAIGRGRPHFSDIVVEARSRMAHRVENLADPDFGQIFEHLYLSLPRAAWIEVDYEGAAEFRGRTVGEIFRVPIIVSRRLV